MVKKELLQNLTRFVKSCNNRRGICAINGLVKTGKTTVLTRLLPKIILQEFPDAEICVLTFTDFLTAHCEPDEMGRAFAVAGVQLGFKGNRAASCWHRHID